MPRDAYSAIYNCAMLAKNHLEKCCICRFSVSYVTIQNSLSKIRNSHMNRIEKTIHSIQYIAYN